MFRFRLITPAFPFRGRAGGPLLFRRRPSRRAAPRTPEESLAAFRVLREVFCLRRSYVRLGLLTFRLCNLTRQQDSLHGAARRLAPIASGFRLARALSRRFAVGISPTVGRHLRGFPAFAPTGLATSPDSLSRPQPLGLCFQSAPECLRGDGLASRGGTTLTCGSDDSFIAGHAMGRSYFERPAPEGHSRRP